LIDALLVLMVVIWGANYSVIKRCFVEIPPLAFNALRLILASAVFLAAIQWARRRARASAGDVSSIVYTPNPVTRRDRWVLVGLGLVGHCAYQLCFVGGVALTSVSNGALIIGATPVVVATASAALGRERLGWLHWLGAAISMLGIYVVVGHGASFGGTSLRGDVLVMMSVGCWAAYTLGASHLIARHSPLYVTGTTMAIGTVPYALIAIPQLIGLDWAAIHWWVWLALVFSALLALCVAYLIWYTAVQRIGPARTSAYSNVVPIVAMTVAAVWLGEPISAMKALGAVAILGGVFFTRLGRPATAVPIEE
jgi:O-acetylserine/cysteine efflux transporter